MADSQQWTEPKGVCDRCGKAFDFTWRFNGDTWEHKCDDSHPQAGHLGRLISLEHRAALQETKKLREQNDALRASLREIHELLDAFDYDDLERVMQNNSYNAQYAALTYTSLGPLWDAIINAQPDNE